MASPPQSLKKPAIIGDGSSRRGLARSDDVTSPVTPPTRFISSNFSTPGSTYGREEDAVILELSPRYIKCGLEGESHPLARYDFKLDDIRRVGDYRQFLPGHARVNESIDEHWGQAYELWRNDIKDLDLGLLSDRLERAVREIYNKYLLQDAGNSRLILVVPSLVAHPVLDTILRTLFERWTIPSIALLPTPAMALVAAGLRSGLVVDIGWEETVVTVCYEYREVRTHGSIRGQRNLTQSLAKWFKQQLPEDCVVNLATVEDFITRVIPYCLRDDTAAEDLEIEWPTATFTKSAKVSKTQLEQVITHAMLGEDGDQHSDDEELPLHWLIYKSLLWLSADIRGLCMSRIVFIGDGIERGNIPTLALNALKKLLDSRGWRDVVGSKIDWSRMPQIYPTGGTADVKHDQVVFSIDNITEERYLRDKQKHVQPTVHNIVRQIDSLGSWTGASLLTSLKIKALVEIQRERFLSHGLGGASRLLEQSVLPQQRMGTLATRSKGERISWTMAGWG